MQKNWRLAPLLGEFFPFYTVGATTRTNRCQADKPVFNSYADSDLSHPSYVSAYGHVIRVHVPVWPSIQQDSNGPREPRLAKISARTDPDNNKPNMCRRSPGRSTHTACESSGFTLAQKNHQGPRFMCKSYHLNRPKPSSNPINSIRCRVYRFALCLSSYQAPDQCRRVKIYTRPNHKSPSKGPKPPN
jgi:hypothetical protein